MSTSSVSGTNAAPISFPGIVSGIDYNSIIAKLTQLSLAPAVGLNASIATLNNANTELIKINNLLACVQNSLQNLSDPNIFNAFSADSSNDAIASATTTSGVAAVPGVYTITKVQTATATTVLSCAFAGHSITDKIGGTPSDQVPLADSYAAVTPTNGGGTLGQITVDGVSLSYNVDTQSLDQILNNITSAVHVTADAGFLATLVNGTVEFTSSDKPISIGSNSDQGNLLDVLKLSTAQVNNTATSGSIVGSNNVGGINPDTTFDASTAAGYKTAVTGGYFTINGVKITVSTGQNTNDIIKEINSSGAGVVAAFNSSSGQIVLTATQTGPQGIVIGAGGDTSNFLTAAGLTTASGSAANIGTQSEVDVQTSTGTQKYFSNSNAVTAAIPGVTLNLASSSATPFTVTVGQDTSELVGAVKAFIGAYNAAVNEINAATAPPVVVPAAAGSGGQSHSVGGGVLFGNTNAQSIVQQLTQIVGGFLGSGSSYNSLSRIGVQLSSTFSSFTATNNTEGNTGSANSSNTSTSGQTIQQTTNPGTDGTLQSLSATDPNTGITFEQELLNAFTSNSSAVQQVLNGSNGLTTVLGTYLTNVTGTPTLLNSGPAGLVPTVSILQNFENNNNNQITTLQQQVNQLNDNATSQANALRTQFVASESLIAQLQAEQQQLAAALGFTISSGKG